MRSRIRQSWVHWLVAASAACSVGVVACSDADPETGVDPLQGAGGSAGSNSSNAGAAGSAGSGGAPSGGRAGSSGSGGAAAGGSAGGAAAGSSAGGSVSAGGAAAGAAGAAGAGPDVGGEPDAGGVDPGEPDPNEPDPVEPGDDQLSFAADLYQQIFVPRCGGCHGTEWGSPNLQGVAYPSAAANADEIAGRVDGSDGAIMPRNCGAGPGQGTCLSVADVASIQSWADQGALP